MSKQEERDRLIELSNCYHWWHVEGRGTERFVGTQYSINYSLLFISNRFSVKSAFQRVCMLLCVPFIFSDKRSWQPTTFPVRSLTDSSALPLTLWPCGEIQRYGRTESTAEQLPQSGKMVSLSRTIQTLHVSVQVSLCRFFFLHLITHGRDNAVCYYHSPVFPHVSVKTQFKSNP